ncbi:MAG: regulatory iron-sulfur-containing complex subunit RicT, partial [Bacteroidota bacterium]|nr:regulatory iron-sulfur-containing complex subunit RicT [Bacteroidota bacterium]
MGCSVCSTPSTKGLPAGCKNNGSCATGGCGGKLDVYDWLSNVYYTEAEIEKHQFVEVKFKGTRKEYFKNLYHHHLEVGDLVIVDSATQGHDAGIVSVKGEVAELQMRKYKVDIDSPLIRRLLRVANQADIEKYEEAKSLEYETMMRARIMAQQQELVMKISDVEYQGDRTKATFFYTAVGRVDFRELIKQMAKEFRIKVEMRQIGLRQEAGRLGGIGSCGRELCCSTWLTDFNSVPTTAARYQNLFLNPLKLSGQCGRLKCCLNFELDTYVEALSEFPSENTVLETAKGPAKAEKFDILKKIVWFRYTQDVAIRFFPIEVDEVWRLIEINKSGKQVDDLEESIFEEEVIGIPELEFKSSAGEDRLDRFDKSKNNRNKNKSKNKNNQRGQNQGNQNPNRYADNDPELKKLESAINKVESIEARGGTDRRSDKPNTNRPANREANNRDKNRGRDNASQPQDITQKPKDRSNEKPKVDGQEGRPQNAPNRNPNQRNKNNANDGRRSEGNNAERPPREPRTNDDNRPERPPREPRTNDDNRPERPPREPRTNDDNRAERPPREPRTNDDNRAER